MKIGISEVIMENQDKVFSEMYSTSLEALNSLNFKLILWEQSGRKQRFGQFLESEFSKLCLPYHYYESNDSFEVFSFVCDLIENEFKDG